MGEMESSVIGLTFAILSTSSSMTCSVSRKEKEVVSALFRQDEKRTAVFPSPYSLEELSFFRSASNMYLVTCF